MQSLSVIVLVSAISAVSSASSSCFDNHYQGTPYCLRNTVYCADPVYRDSMTKYCAKTCGFCTETPAAPVAPVAGTGGVGCAACQFGVRQLRDYLNDPAVNVSRTVDEGICPNAKQYVNSCHVLAQQFIPVFLNEFYPNLENERQFCQSIKFC